MRKLQRGESSNKDRITLLEAENERLSKLLFLYGAIFDKIPYGIQVFDKNGNSFKMNTARKELLGITNPEEGIDRFNVLTDPHSKANGVDKLYVQAYEGKSFTHEFEYHPGISDTTRNTRKDNVTFNETVFPVENDRQEVEFVVSVLSDITKLKKAELQLMADKKELEEKNAEIEAQNEEYKHMNLELSEAREKALESENQFRMLVDNAPEPIYILINYRFVYANLATLKLYGASTEQQILNTSILDRLHPDALEPGKKRLKDLFEHNKPYNSVESKHVRLDGSPVEVEVSSVPIKFNNLNANLVIIKDIHERYQAQKELRHSHDLMSYIIEHNRSAIAVHDRNLNYVYVSQRYLKDYKITDPHIIGKHHYDVFPDLPQKWRDVHQRSLKGEVISAEDDQYLKEDGTMEWTRWECRPWYEADNTIGGIIIYTEVVSDRKKMEEELRETNAVLLKEKQKAEESEAQFRYLLDHAPVPMFIQTNSRFTYVNNALITLYKAKDEAQLLGMLVKERIHPDYLELVNNRIDTLKNEKKQVENVEYKHVCFDQTVIDVEVSAVPIRFNDSDGALVFVNDISRRKKAEEKLIESERILKLFVEYAPAAIAMFDKNMHYLAVSRHYLKDYGLSDTDIIGKSHYDIFPNLPAEWIETHSYCMNGHVVKNDEEIFQHADGKTDWMRWEVHPWYLEGMEIGGIILLTEVITDRKVAEIKLKENMDLLTNLAQQVPGVIYQYRLYPDGSSAFPYSSEGIWNIYEVTSEEVMKDASPVFTRIHPDDYDYIVDSIMESARAQTVYHSEFRVILPKQGVRWRSCFARPQLLDDGSTLWHGVITDITASKEIEQELALKNEELNTFFDCAVDMMAIANTDGYFLRMNREWEKVLGYSIEDLMSKKFLDFVHPDDIPSTLHTMNELSGQKQITNFINRYRCKNGGYKWIEWKSYPKGNKIYAAARDITSRMLFENELEERIQMRTKELLNANKELEAFSYTVSHDLRSPLRAIIGFTNILAEEYGSKLDEEGNRICQVIGSSAVKMGKLIDDLLSFSRLGRNELLYSSFEMKDLIQVAFNETVFSETRQRIEWETGPLPQVTGDYNMLKQVWINLISNAVKYSSTREKAVITIHADETTDEYIFEIKDNGIGFDMQYADKLFGVFQRLHNTGDFEGTGVGLAIVQRIIQRHGGRIWAKGELGKGAAFYTTLPKQTKNEEEL